jgi:hypothetical protein
VLGVVFTEFIESVEIGFGMSVADKVQGACPFHTGFTAVGNYDHANLLTLISKLHQETGKPVPDLVRGFGQHIFLSFLASRPDAFAGVSSTPQLLLKVQESVHLDVRSLYPEAELPQFLFPKSGPNEFRVEYQSSRPFADLAHGILEASVKHYQEDWRVTRQNLDGPPDTHALFVLS